MAETKNAKILVLNTADLQQALRAGYTPENIELASDNVGERIKTARQEGYEKGLAAGRSEVISTAADNLDSRLKTLILKTESERITAIQGLTEPGFENLAKQAIQETWSLEQFALAQLRDKKDRGITLEGIRRDAPRAASHSWPGDGTRTPASAKEIFEKRKQQMLPTQANSQEMGSRHHD